MTYEIYSILLTIVSVGQAIVLLDALKRIDSQNEEISRLKRMIKFKG